MRELTQECDDALRSRIVAEYLEMPGLNVTLPQACRLWNIDPVRCARLLDSLAATGFLRVIAGRYLRSDAGRHAA